MTAIKSFARVMSAAELLSKGIDFSSFSNKQFKEHEAFASGTSFKVSVDDNVKKMFKLPSNNLTREGMLVWANKESDDFAPDLTLNIEQVKQIMQALWEANLESFLDFKEEVYIDNYKQYIKDLDKSFNTSLEMKSKLSRDNTDLFLRIFLALFNYKNGYSKKLYDDSKIDKDFNLKLKTKDFDIIDNRLYIYFKPSDIKRLEKILSATYPDFNRDILKMKAFVISKNVYDYFWASYGNSFQSCFSLNSDHNYIYGYIPLALSESSFICYATTGEVNKIPVVSGKQFLCPNMLWRSWGYSDEKNILLIDKRYTSFSSDIVTACIDILKSKIDIYDDKGDNLTRTLLNDGKDLYKIFKDTDGIFYSDSLKFHDDETVTFQYGCGNHNNGHVKTPWQDTHGRFTSFASTITSVSDSLTLDKPFAIVNHTLLNPKICPVTGFMIDENMQESPFAKFFTRPCTNACMITYIDGCVFCDASTMDYDDDYFRISSKSSSENRRAFKSSKLYIYNYSSNVSADYKGISLKTLKENLKGRIKNTSFDGILLRYFEGSEVKYQFYKKG